MKFSIIIDFEVDETNEQLLDALNDEIQRTGQTIQEKFSTFPQAFYETLVEDMQGQDEEFPGLEIKVRMMEEE